MPFVERNGRRLYYDIIDRTAPWRESRPPILFHHGVGAESGIWTDWIEQLAIDYRIIIFDMCGFGRSDVPAEDFHWSMDAFSDDLLAVADTVGVQTFHFVGESMGGTIGLYCALDHPARFQSLVVSNGSHVGGSIEKVKMWADQIERQGMRGWSDQFMNDRFFPGALSQEKWDWFTRQQTAANPRAILGALAALIGTDLRPRLNTIQQPILLIHADASPFIPVTVVADLHASLSNSELQIFAHARHGLPFSHGRECAKTVRDFLSRHFQNNPIRAQAENPANAAM